MRFGQMRSIVTYQTSPGTDDAAGDVTEAWSDLFTCRAHVRSLTGREAVMAQQVSADVNRAVTILWQPLAAQVTARGRFLYTDSSGIVHTLNVTYAENADERNRTVEVYCTEDAAADTGP